MKKFTFAVALAVAMFGCTVVASAIDNAYPAYVVARIVLVPLSGQASGEFQLTRLKPNVAPRPHFFSRV
jgi:hypothetical protein